MWLISDRVISAKYVLKLNNLLQQKGVFNEGMSRPKLVLGFVNVYIVKNITGCSWPS